MRVTVSVWVLVLLGAACGPRYAHLPPDAPAKLQLAERQLRTGKYNQAGQTLRSFLARTSVPTFRPRAYYELAQAEVALGNHQEALDILAGLHAEFPHEVWGQVSALRGDAHHAVGNDTEAFLAWEEAWAFSSDADRGMIQGRMQAAVGDLDEEEALELSELITIPAIYALIAERVPPEIGAIASARAATEQLAPLEAEVPVEIAAIEKAPEAAPAPTPEELAGVRQLVPVAPLHPAKPAAKVACLLPLTGPDNTYGARALTGLRLAFEDAPDLLTVRDTGGDPAVATRLFDELAAMPSILAVIGPLRSAVAAAVAARANEARVPLLTLAQGEEIAGPSVYPVALTRRQQMRVLAQHVVTHLHAQRFGIVYPDDGYGRSFRQLFMDAVRKAGGQVVGSLAYVPGQVDFDSEVATVEDWYTNRQLDAVFIPDGAATATSLGADLRARMPRLALLGSESWNRPEVIARSAKWLEGAVFSDAFYAESPQSGTRSFVERFQQRNGRMPTTFEAQAYDAGLLIRRVLESTPTTRSEVADHLAAVGRFEGAGRLTATRAGVEREALLLRVHNGRVEEVESTAAEVGQAG